MKPPLLLAVLSLGACVQAPLPLVQVKHDVDSRIVYRHYAGWDMRRVERGSGNCSVFAYNYFLGAQAAGYHPNIVTCRMPSGEGHQYATAAGWALDIRYKMLVPAASEDCR